MRLGVRDKLPLDEISVIVTQFVLHCAEYRSNAKSMIDRNAALVRQDERLHQYDFRPPLD